MGENQPNDLSCDRDILMVHEGDVSRDRDILMVCGVDTRVILNPFRWLLWGQYCSQMFVVMRATRQ